MNKKIITIKELNEFNEFLFDSEKSNATIEKYIRDVRKFIIFLNKRPINKKILIDYKEYLSKNYTLSSANSMIAATNVFLYFLNRKDLHLKKFSIQKKIYCSEEKELTKKEYLKLIEIAEKRGKMRLSLIIQTVCGTGIRISELKYITVDALEKNEAIVKCKGKMRHIFIIPQLKKKLYQYVTEHNIKSGEIFVTKNGKSLDRSNIYREMKNLCKEAKISDEKVYPHNLRHLFARTFYSMEKDIVKLADILGHANINTTRIYIVETGLEHKRKMEKMGLIK